MNTFWIPDDILHGKYDYSQLRHGFLGGSRSRTTSSLPCESTSQLTCLTLVREQLVSAPPTHAVELATTSRLLVRAAPSPSRLAVLSFASTPGVEDFIVRGTVERSPRSCSMHVDSADGAPSRTSADVCDRSHEDIEGAV